MNHLLLHILGIVIILGTIFGICGMMIYDMTKNDPKMRRAVLQGLGIASGTFGLIVVGAILMVL